MAKDKILEPKDYMRISIEEMKKSIQEGRDDGKVSPLVGAVLVRVDGTHETAYRGELRDGDHAEFTLLERKCINENLRGAVVYSTLEPCFERNAPKIGCCKRLVKARVTKVYVGTTDPDPTVNGKGIRYLKDHGVEVEMYPPELQKEIDMLNADFIKGAVKRRMEAEKGDTDKYLAEYEKTVATAKMEGMDKELVSQFVERMDATPEETNDILMQMELAGYDGKVMKPTGLGMLLLGKRPQSLYPNAVVKATWKKDGMVRKVVTFEGPLLKQTKALFDWYKELIPSHIDRSDVSRGVKYDYPLEVVRELSINAIVHRDYELRGAPVYFEVNDDAVVIKSPGLPEPPLTLRQISSFTAPSYSRNPIVMYVLDKFDQVEQRGLGFETVRGLPKKGIPLPEVTYEEPYVVISLPFNRKASSAAQIGLTEEEQRTYDYIRLNEPVTRSAIETLLGVDNKKAVRILNKLISKGVIVSEGKSRGITYSVSGHFPGQSVSKK